MYEKISEIPTREEKVKKLKEKIYREIKKISECVREEMKTFATEINEGELGDWDFLITREFCLLKLKEFIDEESAFQSYEAKYYDRDIIIYQISDDTLNIWLQDDYNFALNFLCKIEHEGYADVYQLLNNRYLGYEFTNIFDEIAYKEKMKKQ